MFYNATTLWLRSGITIDCFWAPDIKKYCVVFLGGTVSEYQLILYRHHKAELEVVIY